MPSVILGQRFVCSPVKMSGTVFLNELLGKHHKYNWHFRDFGFGRGRDPADF